MIRVIKFLCLNSLLLVTTACGMDNYKEQLDNQLIEAVNANNFAYARTLIEQNASVNTKASDFGKTPLYIAAASGYEDVCKLLLENRASVTAKNQFDHHETPLHGAVPCWNATPDRHDAICELLIKNSASVNATDLYGCTPLHRAAENEQPTTCKLLIENKAFVDTKDNSERTPLHEAAADNKNENMCKYLIEHKSSVIAKDCYNKTPLRHAFENENIGICKLLIKTIIDRSLSRETVTALLGIQKFHRNPIIGLVDRHIKQLIARQAWDMAFKKKDIEQLFADIDIKTISDSTTLRLALRTYAQELLAGTMDRNLNSKRQRCGNE